MTEIERKANAELTKAFQKVDSELADIIRAGKPAISSDNFELQEEAERGEALNKRVNETAAYHNALRNERGSLAVPDAEADTEAVNKKQLETHVSEKIAGIVDTLTQQIANAKTEAVQTAKADATSKANAAQAEATQYTDSKLVDYYTKADVDKKIKTLEAASLTSGAGALYDFSKAEAVKTGETIKLADGTVKDIYRLCVGRENVQDNFTIDTSTIGTISRILRINGTLTQTNGVVESATGLIQAVQNTDLHRIDINIKTKNTKYNVLLIFDIFF